jgi:hypothetical protein
MTMDDEDIKDDEDDEDIKDDADDDDNDDDDDGGGACDSYCTHATRPFVLSEHEKRCCFLPVGV